MDKFVLVTEYSEEYEDTGNINLRVTFKILWGKGKGQMEQLRRLRKVLKSATRSLKPVSVDIHVR